jgi:hypothetical protein
MQTHTINLIYDAAHGTVTGRREMRRVEIGDHLVFKSDAGPVHVKVIPADVFSAAEYKTDDPPLEVKKRAKFKYCCGFVIDGNIVGFPLTDKIGSQEDTTKPE